MKTVERIFIIALNFLLPFALVMLMIIIIFFTHGEGAESELMYEKYKVLWLGSYILLGLLNVWLLYRYMKFIKPFFSIMICICLAALYVYYLIQL